MGQRATNEKGREVLLGAQRKGGSGGKKAPRPAAAAGSGGKSAFRLEWRGALPGALLGLMICLVASRLVARLHITEVLLAAVVVGALLGLTRARALLWVAAVGVCVVYGVIGYTPVVAPHIRGLVRKDPLQHVEAVVVLSTDVRPGGELEDSAQLRILHGYEVLGQGYARRLVLTRLPRPKPSYIPAVTAQMRRLGLDYPVSEVGPVRDTHDEALAVSRLVQEQGWKRVILVTDPSHTRRAAAVFERAGVAVLSSPCRPREYDLATLRTPGDRLSAFRDWLHEAVGYEVYRLRGWI